ncbi:hypothetical protein MRB53_040915 [Persea americana]|nr:hypothetical protein MRB53_040915 [Persea americana]
MAFGDGFVTIRLATEKEVATLPASGKATENPSYRIALMDDEVTHFKDKKALWKAVFELDKICSQKHLAKALNNDGGYRYTIGLLVEIDRPTNRIQKQSASVRKRR